MDDEKTNQGDDEQPRIKVTDRRKFASDGKLRPAEEAATEPQAEADASAPPSTTERAAAADSGASTDAGEDTDAGASTDPSDDEAGTPGSTADQAWSDEAQAGFSQLPRDFSAFVETMYLEAMLYMGAIADPRTGEVAEDPELAKYKIDLLIMLQQKTEGNLTAEEKAQLDETLYQLRMLYLQKTKTASL